MSNEQTESQRPLQAVVVSAEVFQALMNTLGQRPYAEVAQLMAALQQSHPIFQEEGAAPDQGVPQAEAAPGEQAPRATKKAAKRAPK